MISTQVKHLWIHSVVCFSSLCICGNLSSTKDVFVCCLFLKYYFEKILQCCFSFGCLGNSNEKIFQAGLQYWFLYNWFIFIILFFYILTYFSIRLFSGRKKWKIGRYLVCWLQLWTEWGEEADFRIWNINTLFKAERNTNTQEWKL